MSYQSVVSKLTDSELALRAKEFADRFDKTKKSVILIPGGMGSRLMQSFEPYVAGQPYPANPAFKRLWLSLSAIVRGDFGDLRILANGRDTGQLPIIAAGELRTLMKAYDETEKYFLEEGRANYTEFGYDWRRNPFKGAAYLKAFLQAIRSRVKQKHQVDPLPELTLFAHSMGGLVTKLFINNLVDAGEDTKKWFEFFISTGTPFYGTLSHVHRYYVGVDLANIILGAEYVREMTATMPGPYGLLPAPMEVLQPRLAKLGLNKYPVVDKDSGQPVDMFASAHRGRFPSTVKRAHFTKAKRMFKAVDRDLTANVSQQIYHFRADATRVPDNPGQHRLIIKWKKINGAAHKPDDPSPVTSNNGYCDGTVPFWSARLPSTPDHHVLDFAGVEHGSMAETGKTIKTVFKIMNGQQGPFAVEPPGPPAPMATPQEVANLVAGIQSGAIREGDAERDMTPEMRRAIEAMSTFA